MVLSIQSDVLEYSITFSSNDWYSGSEFCLVSSITNPEESRNN